MSVWKTPRILLPQGGCDWTRWSVIACDQFTSQPDYWREVERFVGEAPSTLRLIYPEVWLKAGDKPARIAAIRDAMTAYERDGLFREIEAPVYVRRTLPDGRVREGVMIAVDLEAYDFGAASRSAIRATEATVADRLPARVEVREGAPLESPHILLLFDDPEDLLFGELRRKTAAEALLYDFSLNMGGGRLAGYRVSAADVCFPEQAGKPAFLVGDGNHSLATAKVCWEKIKVGLTPEQRLSHPARFALCEAVNLYGAALAFRPIHRAVFGADRKFMAYMQDALSGEGSVRATLDGQDYAWRVPADCAEAIAAIQNALDAYAGITLDYIHGEEHLRRVTEESGAAAIYMPALDKSGLFSYIARRGVLPRKAFSMGEAEEKRYYCECRRILP